MKAPSQPPERGSNQGGNQVAGIALPSKCDRENPLKQFKDNGKSHSQTQRIQDCYRNSPTHKKIHQHA